MEKPLPVPTPTSQPFWDALREHKVRIQYSPSAKQWVFYPRSHAPGTFAADLEWREITGEGVIHTFTIARRPTAPPWEGDTPQLLAVVQLNEGPHLTTELVNIAPEAIRVGMKVRPVFAEIPGENLTLLKYEPA